MTILDLFSLAGKTALVTGGNRGMGLAFARGLAEAGAEVTIVSRSAERNAEAIKSLEDDGLTVRAIDADITAPGIAKDVLAQAAESMGRVDILVNNAGLAIHESSFEIEDEDWNTVMDINLKALWKMSVAAAEVMREQGGGNIVNIGSISALIVNRPQWQPAYNASKAAVHQLTKSLAAEWAPYGIRVNAVAPGYVKTDMAPVDEPHFRQHWIEDAPMKRYAMPEEIAPTVVYMASEASSFMTGSVVVLDGGYTVY
jgi:NAD(P)-dependent dehydrogenase (short-subunit alcohol dehydrogenase family)